MNSTTENISSDARVRIFEPTEEKPQLSAVYRRMAVEWRASAFHWRAIMKAAIAQFDARTAMFASRNADERMQWADEEDAKALHWEEIELRQRDAFA